MGCLRKLQSVRPHPEHALTPASSFLAKLREWKGEKNEHGCELADFHGKAY